MEDSLKAALEIVKAQASVRNMTDEEVISMLKNVAAGIQVAADASQVSYSEGGSDSPAVDPAKAIKDRSITCLECGKTFKVLTKKHLTAHGLTPDEYREKYGYKKGAPLCAKGLQRERRKKMKEMRLWERRKKAE